MATYTTEELIERQKTGTHFWTVRIIPGETETTYDFITGYEDFGSAAKAGGLPDYGVAVVAENGTFTVHTQQDADYYDFGKR